MKNKKEKLLSFLRQVVPDERILYTDKAIAPYNADKTKNVSGSAGLVVLPVSANEVSIILAACNDLDFPVYTRGGGTGVTGGALPLDDGLVLSMERMNAILEIDTKNMVAVVEPNVTTGSLQREVEKLGLFYPPDPASLAECVIGGNVAENAGGPRAVKYGVTKDYVLGMEFVTAEGEIAVTGGKFVKNATGYNMTQLLVGSEGTLAVLTKIYLKLLPLPEFSSDMLLSFETLDDAIDTVADILIARVIPATIEFMEDDAIALVAHNKGGEVPFAEAGAHLLVRLDGNSAHEIESQTDKILALPKVDLDKIMIAHNEDEAAYIWSVRRGIRDAIVANSPVFFAEDCVVPRSEIPAFIKSVKAQLNAYGVPSLLFGHAGDGNVHIDVLKGDTPDSIWEKLKSEIRNMLYNEALHRGGTITGEHGIGYLRKDYLERAVGKSHYKLLKKIKESFDPNNILNPGKMF